jgi:hypothetical protein
MKKHSPVVLLVFLGLILITLAGSCSGPHHGSGNHKSHMTNSMGG